MDSLTGKGLNLQKLSSSVSKPSSLPRQEDLENVNFDEALVVVNDLILTERGKGLSEAEIIVMKGAWNNLDYEEIANQSTYTLNYLQRVVGARLWDTLSKTIGNGERLTKKKLRFFLEQLVKNNTTPSLSSNEDKYSSKTIEIAGRNLPDLSTFYGRTKELGYLKELINKERCVTLIGVAGIGKSTLAAQLLSELSTNTHPNFDCLIWKSVAHAPSFQELLAELIDLIQPLEASSSNLPKYSQGMVSVLIKHMQTRPCLLVLDEYDFLLKTTDLNQRLEYSLFFRRFIEELDKSCLLLTSRFLPGEIENMIEAERPIKLLKLEGLDTDSAIKILSDKGVLVQENCNELIEIYRGNPSELKAVANRINYFFNGNLELFFKNKTTLVSSKFEIMLNETFGQLLNQFQREILIYIAEEIVLTSQPVNFSKLLNDIKQKSLLFTSTLETIKALEKLEIQSLIESSKDPKTNEIRFTLQPVIKKYMKLDPLGLVHTSNSSSKLAFAS
ncbi:NACHT domain-containing protein [Nodularia sp. NIES-3585]|uniref:NACHT domain-containing protein n=1 Tax=Nodularia sp. NIES-3585 TaxID=1973477 RepID=UPI000B5C7483|nr:NACHT domain-containing protein [Nodularia sp. NIES-3585]GAX38948.1 hypothetical protein NIES3585_50000 [Nodularia sp. NIES-3585]